MANIVAIQLEVDAGKSVQEVQNLEEAIKDIQKTTNIDNVEDKFNGLNHSIENGVSSVEGLRKAIKSYQTIALTAGRESPIGKEALLRASKLTDELVDLDNEVKRLSMDGQQMQTALQLGTAVTSGYQAFAGVTALVGEENEDLMKTMVKLQAIQGTLQGIEQVRLALEKESILMLNLRNAKTKIATVLQKAYAFSVGMGSKAMKLFRLALISTGLGALVVLMGSLISKWDDWKDTIMSIIKVAFYPLIKVLEYLGVIESDLDKQRRIANEAYLNQLQAQQDALKKTGKEVQERYDHEIALLKIVGKETYKLERERIQSAQKNASEELDILYSKKRAQISSEEGFTEEMKEEFNSRRKELMDIQLKGYDEIELLDAQHKQDLLDKEARTEKEKQDNYKKWRDKKKAQLEKDQAEEFKAEQDRLKLQEELRIQIENFAIENIAGENERKLAQLQIGHDREREQLIAKYGEDTELLKELELNQANELSTLIDEIEQTDLDRKIARDEAEVQRQKEKLSQEQEELIEKLQDDEDLKINAERNHLERLHNLQLISQEEYLDKKQELDNREKQYEIDKNKAIFDSKQNLYNMSSNLAGNLSQLFEKQNKVSKAFAIAQIGIDTAKAISSLVAMSNANPANAVTSGVAGALQYASGFVSILSNMKQAYSILKAGSPVSAPSMSSSSGSSSGSTSTSTTGTQNTGTTNFATPTSRVYLVESDVQEMRERRENIEAVSTI